MQSDSPEGIHVVVPDLIGLCADATAMADRIGCTKLKGCAASVRSALVVVLDKRYAVLPEGLRPYYQYVIDSLTD